VWNLRFEKEAGIAGFALNQWIRLDLPLPDALVPMPDSDSKAVGKLLAHWLQRPFIKGLKEGVEGLELRPKGLGEGKEILLIDGSNPTKKLQEGVNLLSETFPKRIHVLSLIPCFTCY
jgi:hypothetical protein